MMMATPALARSRGTASRNVTTASSCAIAFEHHIDASASNHHLAEQYHSGDPDWHLLLARGRRGCLLAQSRERVGSQ
jgi:hypothetical protein